MFYFMVLFCLIGSVELITVTTPQKYVNVTIGESALLQCTFVTTAAMNSLIIQWDFHGTKSNSAAVKLYYYQAGKAIVGDDYEGRLKPPQSPNVTRNASITISNMQPSDAGKYTCDVDNFPDVEGLSEVDIIVTVMEKPSKPYCAVHGDVESGHKVTLTCHSERGSPPPTYTWIRLDETKTRRPVLGRVSNQGSLEIANISQFEFGEYQCNASNIIGFSTCSVELNADVADGVIIGAVIGALLGCLLIGLLVWFVVHYVKKRKYKAVNVKDNEMKARSPQAQAAPGSAETETPGEHVEEQPEPQPQPQA